MGKVAIVHDWLTGYRGGEKCLSYFLKLYPEADIFTLIHIKGTTTEEIDARVKKVSFLQKIPFAQKKYRYLLPLFPIAVKSFNLSGYDLIISLSHASAKNATIPKGAKHLCYCFSPMRYIWDQADEYLGKLTYFAWPLIKYLRNWDLKGSKEVAKFIPISQFVSARIRKFYSRRDSQVIYPPTDINWVKQVEVDTQGKPAKGSAFLCFGALVPYKRVDHAILACINLEQELWIVGDGPDRERLERLANNNKNIKFFGKISDQELATLYSKCRALLFPGTEDFGMVPIECLASGRPVIASYTGGAKETMNTFVDYRKIGVKSKIFKTPTGVFFNPRGCSNKVELLISAIKFFIEQENSFLPKDCIEQANLFSVERFFESWKSMEHRA